MSLLSVLQIPDKRLSVKTLPVTVFDAAFDRFIDDMIETMYVEDGVGLAATQVGSDQRVFVYDLGKTAEPHPEVAINPDIYWLSPEKRLMKEGCLSVPFVNADVLRSLEIKVRYTDRQGQHHDVHASGTFAHIFQHEVDHLDGMVFLDRLSSVKRRLLMDKALKGARLK